MNFQTKTSSFFDCARRDSYKVLCSGLIQVMIGELKVPKRICIQSIVLDTHYLRQMLVPE